MNNMKDKCENCDEECIIKFACNFCQEGRMCRECGTDHRQWCIARDDWEFLN